MRGLTSLQRAGQGRQAQRDHGERAVSASGLLHVRHAVWAQLRNLVEGWRRVAIRVVPQTAANAGRRRDHLSQTERVAIEGTARRGLDGRRCGDGLGGRHRGRHLRITGQPRCPGLGRPGRGPAGPAGPLQVLSVTPAAGAKGVNGAAPIRVQFSAPLAASTPMPTLWPHIAGSWQVEGTRRSSPPPTCSTSARCGPSSRSPGCPWTVTLVTRCGPTCSARWRRVSTTRTATLTR